MTEAEACFHLPIETQGRDSALGSFRSSFSRKLSILGTGGKKVEDALYDTIGSILKIFKYAFCKKVVPGDVESCGLKCGRGNAADVIR